MKTMIINYINGNLTTAKKQARKFSFVEIINALRDDYGYTASRAVVVAGYLKGQCTFQQVCDAE